MRSSSASMGGSAGATSVLMMTEVWPARLCCDSSAVRMSAVAGTSPLVDGEAAALDGVDVQQVLEEPLHPLRAALDALHRAPERGLDDAGEQHAHPDGDRVERIAEVVRHDRERLLAGLDAGPDALVLQAAPDLGAERLPTVRSSSIPASENEGPALAR